MLALHIPVSEAESCSRRNWGLSLHTLHPSKGGKKEKPFSKYKFNTQIKIYLKIYIYVYTKLPIWCRSNASIGDEIKLQPRMHPIPTSKLSFRHKQTISLKSSIGGFKSSTASCMKNLKNSSEIMSHPWTTSWHSDHHPFSSSQSLLSENDEYICICHEISL